MTTAIASVTISLPDPDAEALADALTAIAAVGPPDWFPVTSDAGAGRMCRVGIGAGRVEIFEVPAAALRPEQLALAVTDPVAALDRLATAGITVEPAEGDPAVAGSALVAGIRLLVVRGTD